MLEDLGEHNMAKIKAPEAMRTRQQPRSKIWSEEELSEYQQRYVETAEQRAEAADQLNIIPDDSGILYSNVTEPKINFDYQASDIKVAANKSGNAGIVLGRDRPSNLQGYGLYGAQGAPAIDLVAGRYALARGGRGPEAGTIVTPSMGGDAARVYISAMTDIDFNFGLCDSNIPRYKAHSGIGIKADGVRIIGREGVKIVTGKSIMLSTGMGGLGETNSLGGELAAAPPIELIAGNSNGSREIAGSQFIPASTVNNLQPLIRGENVVKALDELGGIVEDITSALFNLTLVQMQYNTILGVTPIYPHAAAAPMTAMQFMNKIMNSLWHSRINKTLWTVNYLEPYGSTYICSRNVFGT